MCWVHILRNVETKLRSLIILKENAILIKNDIIKLQSLPSEAVFDRLIKLFIEKWQEKEQIFIEYFKTERVNKNRNWYDGYAIATPSNNALKSCNRVLKDEQLLRERLPLHQFKVVALEIVGKWSKDYYSGIKVFKNETTITLPIWTSSYQSVRLKKKYKNNKRHFRYYSHNTNWR